MDTGNDGIEDSYELYTYYTNPKDADTDNGGENDKSEIDNGRDPLDPSDDFNTACYRRARPLMETG